jgi:hypothetical protein
MIPETRIFQIVRRHLLFENRWLIRVPAPLPSMKLRRCC